MRAAHPNAGNFDGAGRDMIPAVSAKAGSVIIKPFAPASQSADAF